jgi:uncharacterized protein (TIGR03437 family)
VKQVFRMVCALIVLTLASGAFFSAVAQTPSATPEPFLSQLSSGAAGFNSYAKDITANGRFVVVESNGDIATEKIPNRDAAGNPNPNARNNEDGNREIFLIDYAQQRVFQITNTKNVPKATPTPTPTPTPSPSPTPTPSPTPPDPANIQIEVSNNRPMITLVPGTNGHYRIVFSSNAPHPALFNGVDTGNVLAGDGNQEIWVYELPVVSEVDLTTGTDFFQDLTNGAFIPITTTPASRVPSPGGTGIFPFVADDNRDATISETGEIIVFISTRNLASNNADGNPELFFHTISTPDAFVQGTATADSFVGPVLHSVFQESPSISADGSIVAFISNGNLNGNNNDDGSGHGNAEVYLGSFNGSSFTITRQATRTKDATDPTADNFGATVNLFSLGRRLSRDGSMFAFDSLADDPKANAIAPQSFLAVFVYDVALDTFALVGKRALSFPGDVIHFPTFTDYSGSLAPATLIYASALNFRADGTFPPTAEDSTGLNPSRAVQVFSTALPIGPTSTFRRLTRNAIFSPLSPLTTSTIERSAFSTGGELGGGNADGSTEVFYLLSPTVTTVSATPLSFFTGASNVPLPEASPSPSPSPTPTPSPGTATGLAAGELGIIRTTVEFVAADASASGVSETTRSPALPVELNGVSVSVNGAAAGLYFVGQASKQINFVVPIGMTTGVKTVVVHSRLGGGTQIRGSLLIVPAQPDIFTSTMDAGGRAAVFNVTNPMSPTPEPFNVTSPDGSGNTVPTVLEINLTGVRSATAAEVKVSIVTTAGTTDIMGDQIVLVRPNREMPGWDIIRFKLPAALAGAGDVPIIVTVTRAGVAFVSRPAATAPHITIN